ncbi:acyltransferase [Sinomonas gamaensis]|uniref:acyltransferase n=1 Tax=Sinomonas gamaensis TaxID=2565624 RepID=UPI0014873C0F|nr:acyltransferase [Sinomonas gamaensis]
MGLGVKTRLIEIAEHAAFSPLIAMTIRWRLLRALGWSELGHAHIKPGCFINGHKLKTGEGCYFNRGVFIDASAQVTMGSHVQIGPPAMVLTATHRIGTAQVRGGDPWNKAVTIGDGCWIGAGAIIMPGVDVASGCIVASGAVVTKDTEPNGIYAGVPAQRIRELDVA